MSTAGRRPPASPPEPNKAMASNVFMADEPPPVDDDLELTEVVEVANGQGPRPARGRPAAQSHFRAGQTREMRDSLMDAPDISVAARRRRVVLEEEMRLQDNPFLRENNDTMPALPPPDEEWTYIWRRHRIDGKDDTKNLYATQRHGLQLELVRAEDLPAEFRQQLQYMANVEGRFGGYIIHNDLIAARCPTGMYRMYQDAQKHKAREPIKRTRADYAEQIRRIGMAPRLEEDDELDGELRYID